MSGRFAPRHLIVPVLVGSGIHLVISGTCVFTLFAACFDNNAVHCNIFESIACSLGIFAYFIFGALATDNYEQHLIIGIFALSINAIAYGTVYALIYRSLADPVEQSNFGFCTNCGYDMRGSLEAGHIECPECGEHYDVRPILKPKETSNIDDTVNP